MKLPITKDNVRDWFPSPHVENPLAGEPWWQLQSFALATALQIMRLVPDGQFQQQALVEVRRAFDTALLAVPSPPDEEIQRRMAQTLAPWCPTPVEVVEAMLDLADIRLGDHLFDLGSGDGRIVLAAARRGIFATGIEIDGRFCIESEERAYADGLMLARFRNQDILDADLSDATIVTCYLLSSSMEALKDKLRQLKPGTRIISHAFSMEGWEPIEHQEIGDHHLYLWVVA